MFLCILKKLHLLLLFCELSVLHSIESSDRYLSACHCSYSWGALACLYIRKGDLHLKQCSFLTLGFLINNHFKLNFDKSFPS